MPEVDQLKLVDKKISVWKLEFSKSAEKSILKLDKKIQEELKKYFKKVIDNPKAFGKALNGNKKGLWRYRIGDYRAICEIKEKELIIFTLLVDHRRKVYEN